MLPTTSVVYFILWTLFCPFSQIGAQVDTMTMADNAVAPVSMPGIAWDKELKVEPGEVAFEERDAHAYTITIYGLDEQKVNNLVKKEWKGKGKKGSSRRELSATDMLLPAICDSKLFVLGKGSPNLADGSLKLSVAFMDRGTPIGPETMPEQHQKAMDYMYELSIMLNRAAVEQEIAAQIKMLDAYQKELAQLEKEQQKLESQLNKAQAALDQANADIDQNDAAIQAKKEEISAFETEMRENRNAENQRLLSRKRRELSDLENASSKYLKTISTNEARIAEVQKALPPNREAQQRAREQVEMQQMIVDQYRQKKKDVH